MVDKKSNVSIKGYFRGRNEKKWLPDPTNDLNIIPSWNKEFACLIGLEEVVQFRLERLDKTVYTARKTHKTGGRLKRFPIPAIVPATLPKDPYTCAKCNTDVSRSWKHDMNSSCLCYSCFKCSWRKDHWHSTETIIKSISDNPSILSSSSQPLWNEPQSMKEAVFPLQNSSRSVPQDCDQQVPKNSLSSSSNFHPDSTFYSSSPVSSDLSSSPPEYSSSSYWSSSFSSDHHFSYIYHTSSSCDSSLCDCSSPTYLPSSSDFDSSSSMSSSPSDFPPTNSSKQVSQKVKMPYWMETPLAKALLKDDKGERKTKKEKAEQSITNKSQSKKEKTGKMAALSLPSSSNQQILPDTKSALPVSVPSLSPLLSVSKHHFQTQMLTPNLQKKTIAEKDIQTMEEWLKPGHGNLKKVTPNVSRGYVSCTTLGSSAYSYNSGKSKSTVHSLPTSWSPVSGNITQQDLRSRCFDDKKESIKPERFGTKMQHQVSNVHPSSSLISSAPTHTSFLSQPALSTIQGKTKSQEKVKWGAAPNQKIDKWIQMPKTSMVSHGSCPSCSSSSSVWSTRETEPASSGVTKDENLHYKVQVNL